MRIVSGSGFATAVVEVEGLAQWMWGAYGSSSANVLYAENGISSGFSMSVEPHDVENVTIQDGTTIEFHFVTNTHVSAAPPNVTIDKQILIWMFPIEPVSHSDYFWRLARKIANLLSFITGEYLDITSILAYEQDFRQDYSLLHSQEPISIVSKELPTTTNITFINMYSDFPKVKDRFHEIMTKWFGLYEDSEYGIDLYFSNSIEKSNKYLSTRLAVALMALEALYQGRGGSQRKLSKRLIELMEQFDERFGNTDDIRTRASRIVAMRKEIVHGSGGARYVVDGSEEMVDTLLNVEAMFEMTLLLDLGFDVDEKVTKQQRLARRIRRPRGFGG